MEEQTDEARKGWKKFWGIVDVCLFGGCILLFLIQWDPIGIVSYLTGYFGGTIWATFDIWILFCCPMYVLILIIGVIRMINWQNSSLNPWTILFFRIVLILLLVLCFPLVATSIPAPFPKPLRYIMGFQEWTQAHLDIEEVRVWMDGLDEEAFDEHRIISVVSKSSEGRNHVIQTPKCLLGVYPLIRGGSVYKDREGKKCIKMYNGSGHGHGESLCMYQMEEYLCPFLKKRG